jgi:hypothetical protein
MTQPNINSSQLNIGTEDGDLVVLETVDGSPLVVGLPSTDGSQLTGINPEYPMLAPDGVITAPSYSFDNDPNTGIYSFGVDQLGFTTNSLARLIIDDDGTLKAMTASYETLVLLDNDIPNKKYVDDSAIAAVAPAYELQSASSGSPLQTVFNTTISTVSNYDATDVLRLQVFVNGLLQLEDLPGSPTGTKAYTVTGANQITFNVGVVANADVALVGF